MQPDNNQVSQTPVQNIVPVPVQTVPNQPVAATPQNQYQYADVWTRFFAVLIDGVIFGIFSAVMGGIVAMLSITTAVTAGSSTPNMFLILLPILINLLVYVLMAVYFVYFIGSKGQTPGKMIMKVKVIRETTGEVLGYGGAFMREVIGKLVSGIPFGIGYFVAFGDPKHQGWHDKIAGSVVIKV